MRNVYNTDMFLLSSL